MSDAVIIALISAAVTMVNSVLIVWLKLKGLDPVKSELKSVHTEINSKMDAMLTVSKEASHAQGKLEAIQEIKIEQKEESKNNQ